MSNILSINNLSIHVGHRELIKNTSFEINEGDAILLSGPNGVGKSSILKSVLRLDSDGKQISGAIQHRTFGDILQIGNAELQRFRSSIAYVQQRDEYAEMGNIQVKDIISESFEAHSGKSLSFAEVNDLIDEWIPRLPDNKRIFDSKSRPAKFSGGEQRLLSVLSVISTRSNADLLIVDEPLNNLDFANARNISNLINKVIKSNPSMGLIMVSHCRIFPFINREISLSPDGVSEETQRYVCHSCFGEPDSQGYYN